MMLPSLRPARALTPLLALLTPFLAAGSQQVRGSVTDSAARTPVVGAVVETLDSAGAALSRGLTNELGAYAIGRSAGARRLRVVRMGYRPRDVELPAAAGAEQRVDLAMLAIPTFLEPVIATAPANCPGNADGQRAFSLLEQARAGLLATIVSREMSPPAIKILRYERVSDGDDRRTLRQSVLIDSNTAIPTSFAAVRNARRFVEQGFIADSGGNKLYLGPDADVMLDPAFAGAYCFRIRRGRQASEIGLSFSPGIRARKGRTDINGTLWIDTVAKVVSEIAFTYIGSWRRDQGTPGGSIHFRSMPNGSVLIDRWYFRMPDSRADTATGSTGNGAIRTYQYQRESGGEVAWAHWSDGHSWKASLATVRLKMVDKFGQPVTRAVIRFTDTDYTGTPDKTGTVVFNDVLPGPYDVEIRDSALVSQDIIIKSATHFLADRDKVIARTVVAPPPYAFFKLACQSSATGRWVEYHALDARKHPLQVTWKLGEDLGGRLELLRATGTTLRDGVFGYCRDLDERAALSVELTHVQEPYQRVVVELPGTRVSLVVPVVMPFRSFAGR
jgi:hypothetical protein